MELEKILENENGKVYLDYEYLKGKILKKYPNLMFSMRQKASIILNDICKTL